MHFPGDARLIAGIPRYSLARQRIEGIDIAFWGRLVNGGMAAMRGHGPRLASGDRRPRYSASRLW